MYTKWINTSIGRINSTVRRRSRKRKNLLDYPVYKKIKKDPTLATERKVLRKIRELEKQNLIPRAVGMKLKPTSSTPPKIYGLPKLHTPDIPLRPIVSCITSPTYHLAKFTNTLISPLSGNTPSFIKNSRHFLHSVRNLHIEPDEVMVSLISNLSLPTFQ